MHHAGSIPVLTRDAIVQTQMPPALRAITQGMHMVGMAGAPVIVGAPARTPQERAAAHHGVPLQPARAYVAPTITGHGGHGGHGHGHGGRGRVVYGGWGGGWGYPSVNIYNPLPAGPDCASLAAQAQIAWAPFGVTQVVCGTDSTGRPALVAYSTTPMKARRSIPPTFGNMPTSVA